MYFKSNISEIFLIQLKLFLNLAYLHNLTRSEIKKNVKTIGQMHKDVRYVQVTQQWRASCVYCCRHAAQI